MAQFLRKNFFSLKHLFPLLKTRSLSQSTKSSSNIFSLFAPTVEEVNFASSFTNWKSIPMIKDHKTGIFRIPPSIQINDGEHEYKFSVRKNPQETYWTSVIDPYVERYDAKQSHGLITIKNGKKYSEIYDWKYDHIKLPENDQLIIYELYVADFSENGQFSGVLSKLNHLVELGINAIELLPIQGMR